MACHIWHLRDPRGKKNYYYLMECQNYVGILSEILKYRLCKPSDRMICTGKENCETTHHKSSGYTDEMRTPPYPGS